MGRQLEFDRTQAVALAVDAFWRHGYEALPALELAQAMGVGKSSLYNTFGSKKTLFLEALDHYGLEQRSRVARLLHSSDPRAGLQALLLEIASDNSGGRGCLLVNAAAELGLRDEEVRQRVKAGLDGLTQAFASLIRAAQASGDVEPQVDAQDRALVLIAGIAGMRVLAKSGFSGDQLAPVVATLQDEFFH